MAILYVQAQHSYREDGRKNSPMHITEIVRLTCRQCCGSREAVGSTGARLHVCTAVTKPFHDHLHSISYILVTTFLGLVINESRSLHSTFRLSLGTTSA